MPSAIRHFIIAFLIAALIFSILGAIGLSFMGKAVREKEKSHVDDTQLDDSPDHSDDEGQGSVGPSLKGQSFSLLLILNDYQPDRYEYGYPDNYSGIVYPRLKQATALVYLRFNRENATLYSAVIPPESLVMVEGVEMTLAEAYHHKGAAFVCDRVSTLIGTRIGYYVSAGYNEFVSFINSPKVNGITMTLGEEMDLNLRSGSTVHLQTGSQYLDGERSLALLTASSVKKTALYELQRSFAYALLEKLTTLQHKQDPDGFFASVLARFDTNLTAAYVASNTEMMFSYFDLTKNELTVPGNYTTKGDFVVNREETAKLFRVGAVLEQ